MKKIFTLISAVLVTLTSFADHNDGMITITYLSKKQTWIEVDGKRYNNRDREIVIRDLQPGYHRIQVYTSEKRNDWRDIFDLGRKQMLYNSSLYVRPRQHIDIVINRFGKVLVDERSMNDRNYDDDDRDYDRDYDRDRDRNHDKDRDYDRDGRWDNNRSPMDSRSFDMLVQALRRENFEQSRLEIAKQSIDRNNFTSLQVKQLAQCFAFDNFKLDLAKHAYSRTVDRDNYFVLNDVFSFSNSKDELAAYIRRYK